MPNGFQSDLDDAYKVCNYLNIRHSAANIECINDDFLNIISGIGIISSEQTKINLPSRIRMTMLYAISQSVNGRVANTCNWSEDYVGYSTRWGDSVGDFAPLGRLLTDEVIAIGDALGLPYDLVHKTPSDGLCGKTDEDNLGFTYEDLNQYIRMGTCGKPEVDKIISDKHEKNLFKMQPIPTFKF